MVEDITLPRWWSFILRGIVALIFGVIVLTWPGATTLVLLILFGSLVLVSGLFALGGSIAAIARKEKWGAEMFLGILGILIGIVAFTRPGIVLETLIVIVAIWMILSGAIELFASIELPKKTDGKVWLGIAGVLSMGIGILFLAMPAVGIWTAILIIGIYSLVFSVVLFVLGFRVKGLEKATRGKA
ncbi:MAG: DUF308 domain-containing protein [Actinobacteria bacterium]|nr:DUF308 domain-containing protein [Actinomycetota bacterium]